MNASMWPLWHFTATAVRAVDGDTLRVMIDQGFYDYTIVDLRLLGMNAPEVVGEEKVAGLASRDALWRFVEGKTLYVESYKGQRSFARWLADVYVDDGTGTGNLLDVGTLMVEAGFATDASPTGAERGD